MFFLQKHKAVPLWFFSDFTQIPDMIARVGFIHFFVIGDTVWYFTKGADIIRKNKKLKKTEICLGLVRFLKIEELKLHLRKKFFLIYL